jgi:tetratricopeptide (TPR) repeat protein
VMEMYAQAEADLRRAIALDETLTEAWWGLSKLLYHLGEDAEAHRAAVRAIETDAFLTSDIDNLWHIFLVALESEDHVAARHWCDELATRFGDTQTYPYCELYLLTSSPRATPDVDRAWRMAGLIVDRATEASRDIYSQAARMQVAKVLVRAGQPDSARAVVARTLPDSVPAWATYDVAHFHLLLGEDDSALDLLDRWTAYNPVRARRLAHDWWFERLRGDPRFDRLVGRGPG